jgi:hypothetical protein
MGRPPAGTEDWAPAFLGALLQGDHVRDSALVAGVHVSVPYERRKHNAEFAAAWKEAQDIGTEALEAEATRRAFHGTLKPVFHKGEECGYIREYSDRLIEFLLRGRKPEVYREKFQHEHSGRDGAPIPISVVRFLGHDDPDKAAVAGDKPA